MNFIFFSMILFNLARFAHPIPSTNYIKDQLKNNVNLANFKNNYDELEKLNKKYSEDEFTRKKEFIKNAVDKEFVSNLETYPHLGYMLTGIEQKYQEKNVLHYKMRKDDSNEFLQDLFESYFSPPTELFENVSLNLEILFRKIYSKFPVKPDTNTREIYSDNNDYSYIDELNLIIKRMQMIMGKFVNSKLHDSINEIKNFAIEEIKNVNIKFCDFVTEGKFENIEPKKELLLIYHLISLKVDSFIEINNNDIINIIGTGLEELTNTITSFSNIIRRVDKEYAIRNFFCDFKEDIYIFYILNMKEINDEMQDFKWEIYNYMYVLVNFLGKESDKYIREVIEKNLKSRIVKLQNKYTGRLYGDKNYAPN